MAFLIKPGLDEMEYHRKLHASAKTMNGRDNTQVLSDADLQKFYEENVDCNPKDQFFCYQFCPDCADFTGELGWKHNVPKKRYELFILIQYEYRHDGYGKDGIQKLRIRARKNGIPELYAVLNKNHPAVGFFEKTGMIRHEDEGDQAVFSLKTAD